jgi:Holliday junction resolvase RusA-like endonuclease
MASSIRFTVPGNPVPQPRPRISTRGGFARAYVPKEHPIHVYRQAIALMAKQLDVAPHQGDVAIDIAAVFGRPPSHKRLGSKAPSRPVKCDWDNVAKGVCDALNGIAYVDDDQIIDAHVTRRYARPGEAAHTAIIITRL